MVKDLGDKRLRHAPSPGGGDVACQGLVGYPPLGFIFTAPEFHLEPDLTTLVAEVFLPVFDHPRFGQAVLHVPAPDVLEMHEHILEGAEVPLRSLAGIGAPI